MDKQLNYLIYNLKQFDTIQQKQIYIDRLPMLKRFHCTECKKNNIKCINKELAKLDNQPLCKANRVLLTSYPNCSNTNVNLLDSVIIDLNDNRVLSVFPKRHILYSDLHHQKPQVKLTEYKIRKLVNGTMYTIYFDNEWIIHTKNNYNANDNIIYGTKNNADILFEFVNIDLLDKNSCHTFIVTDPEVHVMESKSSITFIESVNLLTFDIIKSKKGFKIMKTYPNENNKLSDLINNAKESLNRYDETGNKFYGYLLETDDDSCNVMIESRLMIKIRQVFYDKLRDYNILAKKFDSQNHNLGDSYHTTDKYKEERDKYLSLYIYVSSQIDMNKPLLKLFHIYTDRFKYYDSFYEDLTTQVITKNTDESPQIVNFFYNLISNDMKCCEQNRKTIRDIIKSYNYIDNVLEHIMA